MKKKVIVPIFLAAMAFPLCLRNDPIGLSAEFVGEQSGNGNETSYVRDFGIPTNNQMADEGFVLLKNDGSLPLEEGAKVSIVGKASINLARGGAGSGAGSISNSVKNQFANGESDLGLDASLKAVGFEVNATATSFFKNTGGNGRTNGNDGWKGNSEVTIGEIPISSITSNAGLMDSLDEYNDAILQVITREGSEGCDVKTCNTSDSQKTNSSSKAISDKHALELSDNEQALFDEIKEHTDHVIIIINSSNVFECDQFENDDKVSGILWIGNPGDVGPLAVGRILSGQVNPSGRTVDTWARDFTKDPTFQNFSDNAQTNKVDLTNGTFYAPQDTMFNADGTPTRSYGTDKSYSNTASPRWDSARGGKEAQVVSGGINGVKPSAYVSYEEGIYVDYRYYETRYADMLLEDEDAANEWYNGEEGVVYPFGFGLSYTEFEQKIVRVRVNPNKGNAIDEETDLIEVTVKVKNIGDFAGKDAVQLYWKAPYYVGEIEKADHVLCAFDKSELLEPGESQYVQLTFHVQDVANYDFTDANNNGFAGYELDEGEHSVLLCKNAHEVYDEAKFEVQAGGVQYENDRFTGHKVENRFTDRGFYNSLPAEEDIEFTQMSRADFEGTFPTHPTIEDRTLGADSRVEEFLTHEFSIDELEQGNFEYVPEGAYKTEQDAIDGNWSQAATTQGDIKLNDMKDVPYEDEEAWNEFINQLSWSDMLKITETNTMSSKSISGVGKNGYSEGDGPQKFSVIWWVSSPIIAATFNPRLAHKQGECIGMESHIKNKAGWWGSAVNTHRSPFGGRNFEYYSADPFLMGRIAAEVVGTATDRGVYAYFKHFAVNDQEKNRESGISYLTEQALREIYLKSFQMVFEEGKSIGVMASYNRLGLMETAASYPLLTEVLRGEWGFKGGVLSDMTHSSNGSVNFKCYENVNNRVLAGCNAQLDQGSGFGGQSEAKWDSTLGAPAYTKNGEKIISYSYWYATREAVKGHMYMGVHSTGQFRGMTKVDATQELNVEIGEYFEFDINNSDIVLSDDAWAEDVKLNDRVDLPKGIEFEDGVLYGEFEEVGLYRFDFIVTTDLGTEENPDLVAVKLIVNANPSEDEYVEDGDPFVPGESSEPVNPDPVDPDPVDPSSSEVAPASSEADPASSGAAPASSEAKPASSESAPVSSEVEPASSEAAPASSEVAPASSEAAPASSEVTPAPSSTTPVTPDQPASSTPASSSADNNNAKKGCGGDITSVGALVGLIALAGISLALIYVGKKRRA